jgi:serine/threonine protein kinase
VTLTPGTRLGPYEIVAAIGRGGMGEVYRARDTRLKREIAIKILPAHVTSQSNRRQRFEREAQVIAAVSHPHICALFDVGSQDGVDFLVMEYLEGETLDRRLVRGALPLNEVFQRAIEIAEALDHAHRHGIVHRDLKPANIMLTKAGAKLLDFGLAGWNPREPVQLERIVSENAAELPETRTLTAEGTILGTLQYMAPEQLEGKATDAHADLFAFGAIVYEMATGRRAFSGGSNASLIAAILMAEPAPISAVEPLTPPGLERIVKKCLAKDPELRWQTARDLLDELTWVAEGGSHEALPLESGARRRASEGGRSARLRWAGAGLLAAITAVVGGLFVWRSLLTGATEQPSVRDLQVLVFEDQHAGFENAVRGLGTRTVIDFEDVDAGPVTNSVSDRPPFDRFRYASHGIVFSNPNNLSLYIAPRGLVWNPTNSLSVGPFPFHPLDKLIEAPFIQDDDLAVTFEPGCSAVAFSVIDKGDVLFGNFVEFIDIDGHQLRLVSFPRAFIGLVAPLRPDGVQVRIGRLVISEAADDGDDVTYDNFICIR